MESIFIAEGETHVREAMHLALEHRADLVTAGEAANAEDLLAQVCQRPPDVILLDWALPGFHPQRLIRALREHCPETIIIATSVKPEHRNVASEFGLDGFISKQYSPDSFMAALDTILGAK